MIPFIPLGVLRGTSIYDMMAAGVVYIAHRGCALRYPESTTGAFSGSIADGYTALECDAQLLSDGNLAVFHDTTIDGATTGTGNLVDTNTTTYDALTVDAGSWFGGGFGNLSTLRLPALLAAHKGAAVFLPEAKYPTGGNTEALGDAIVADLQAAAMPFGQVVVTSFDLTPLGPVVTAGYPAAIIEWPDQAESIAAAQSAGVTFAFLNYTLSDARINEWLAAGFYVGIGVVNRRVIRDRVLALGVHMLNSDDPEYLEADTPFATSDNFASGEWQPGMVAYNHVGGTGLGNLSAGARGRFVGTDQWGYESDSGTDYYRGCLQGWACPIASDPDNDEYLIDLKVEFGAVGNADQTRWASVHIAATDEEFTGGSQGGAFSDHVDAYAFIMRKNGDLVIDRRPFSGFTRLAESAGTAITDDEEVRFQIEVNASKLELRRLDGSGNTVQRTVSYDVTAGFRGGYFHLGHSRMPALFRDISIGSSTAYSLWTPAQVAPSIWLADDSDFNEASGACAQWNDIAGTFGTSLLHFDQGTAADRPTIQSELINSLDALRFDGSTDHLDGPADSLDLFRNVDYAWVFAVYYKTNTDGSNTERPIFFASVNGGAGTRFGLFASNANGQNTAMTGGRRLDGDSFYPCISATARSQEWVMALGVIDYGERTITLYIDGEQDNQATGQFTAAGSTSDTDSDAVRVGSNSYLGGTTFLDADVPCVVVGASSGGANELSSTDIDKLFGWAAHRYGLTANLGAGHPYKSSAPTV